MNGGGSRQDSTHPTNPATVNPRATPLYRRKRARENPNSSPESVGGGAGTLKEKEEGRVRAADETGVVLVDDVMGDALSSVDAVATNSPSVGEKGECADEGGVEMDEHDDDAAQSSQAAGKSQAASPPCLTTLPAEIIDAILLHLPATDLLSLSLTCRTLHHPALSDSAWHPHIQSAIPGIRITSPSPLPSYHALYLAHSPRWMLPKYKIWFSDYYLTGKILIARYDPRRGTIEAYRLLAETPPPTFAPWEHDPEVIIHSFSPTIKLHMDAPVVQLDPVPAEMRRGINKYHDDVHMFSGRPAEHPGSLGSIMNNFMLAKRADPTFVAQDRSTHWPPPTIPSPEHAQTITADDLEFGSSSTYRPQNAEETSERCFRIRRWMQIGGVIGRLPHLGTRIGEEVVTYATLEPWLYTPTREKPWRGIWAGDYAGHGVEFLLVCQPEDEDEDQSLGDGGKIGDDGEIGEEGKDGKEKEKEKSVYRGRLEAIKLTGDLNVPRGEYTFIVNDLGDAGFVRNAEEEEFKGARIVKSRGHIAARGFKHDKYIESQLIMISPNKLAQYWVGFGHISYYERVDVEQFLDPGSERWGSRGG